MHVRLYSKVPRPTVHGQHAPAQPTARRHTMALCDTLVCEAEFVSNKFRLAN